MIWELLLIALLNLVTAVQDGCGVTFYEDDAAVAPTVAPVKEPEPTATPETASSVEISGTGTRVQGVTLSEGLWVVEISVTGNLDRDHVTNFQVTIEREL